MDRSTESESKKIIMEPGLGYRDFSKRNWSFFCPHCRVERRSHTRPNPLGFQNFFRVGLTALVFTLAAFPWLGWKGLVSFVPIWMVFEIVYRVRMRAFLICPHCGFDPFVYLTDVKKARNQVESTLREQYQREGSPFPGDAPESEALQNEESATPEETKEAVLDTRTGES